MKNWIHQNQELNIFHLKCRKTENVLTDRKKGNWKCTNTETLEYPRSAMGKN